MTLGMTLAGELTNGLYSFMVILLTGIGGLALSALVLAGCSFVLGCVLDSMEQWLEQGGWERLPLWLRIVLVRTGCMPRHLTVARSKAQ